MSPLSEEEDLGDPDVVLAQVQFFDDEWEGGGDDGVLESTEDADPAGAGDSAAFAEFRLASAGARLFNCAA